MADGPVGPYVACDPVGSYGMLSPRDPDQLIADGPVGPHVTRGPVGSYGMLSPCNSDFDPVRPVADIPVGPYVARGPVGSYGTLSPCDSDTTGPVMPVRTLPLSPQDDGERMNRPGGSSGSNVAETPTAVAVVDLMGIFSAGRILTLVIGRFGCVRASVGCCDWRKGCTVIFVAVGSAI